MNHRISKVSAVAAALAFAGVSIAWATTTDSGATTASTTLASSSGQDKVATRFASPFATLAGSEDNAVALATALRTGTPGTLTYTAIVDGKPVVTTEVITPPTKPMGWGNVSHALALAQYSLTRAGITSPTAADLQAALVGGKITTVDGKVVTLDGVLQQRASGMGWGQIAHSEGTTMGAVNRQIKAPTVVARSGGTASPKSSATTAAGTTAVIGSKGVTTAVGSSAVSHGKGTTTAGGSLVVTHGKGVTTAGGRSVQNAQSTGLTTAAGATSASHGSKGLVTAGSTPAGTNAGAKGLSTAGGASSSSGLVTAGGSHVGGSASHGVMTAGTSASAPSTEHGKGKGGG